LKKLIKYDNINNSFLWRTEIAKYKEDEVKTMKKEIQPNYAETTITCACGNVMKVGSTKTDMKVDICSKCHPFWTGNLMRRDTAGSRADRFKKKYGLA
jgi:large subunit ribosomal protein L31